MASGKKKKFENGMQTPTLVDQIKAILHQYPDDGQILKELIQNADDAGAYEVKFLLDNSHYPTDHLFSPHMKQYQGPALLAYNDACFTEEDWDGILLMYRSIKEKDALKVGRFGLGFKSVFHMTDVPSVLSGSDIGFMDPHERLFRREDGARDSANSWSLQDDRSALDAMPDQWLPYLHPLFGLGGDEMGMERTEPKLKCALPSHYPHTLFRFPLRPASHTSKLVGDPEGGGDGGGGEYPAERLRRVFRSLRTEGHLLLLFLRRVESIALYETSAGKDAPPVLRYRVRIDPECRAEVREMRRRLLEQCRNHATSREARDGDSREARDSIDSNFDDSPVTYRLRVLVESYDDNSDESEEAYEYLVCQHCAPDISLDLAQHLPLVGAALPLIPLPSPLSPLPPPGGHIFCFLPLPLQPTSPTGLALHVNGYFGLEQNRRHIKWPSAETTDGASDGTSDATLQWNLQLVADLLPAAMLLLARFAATAATAATAAHNSNITPQQYYRLFPDAACVTAQWQPLVQAFYRRLAGESLFLPASPAPTSPAPHPLSATEAVVCCLADPRAELAARVLCGDRVPTIMIPPHVLQGLQRHLPNPSALKLLSRDQVYRSLLKTQDKLQLSREERLQLLLYLAPHNLRGLKLLPLLNGEWAAFSQARERQDSVYMPDARFSTHLIPHNGTRIISSNLPSDVHITLSTLRDRGQYQLRLLDEESVIHEVTRVLQQVATQELVVDTPRTMTENWLELVWEFLENHLPNGLSRFERLPLIPLPNKRLCLLSREFPVMVEASKKGSGSGSLSQELKEMLERMGVLVIRGIPEWVARHPGIGDFILAPSKLAQAIQRCSRGGVRGKSNIAASVSSASPGQKRALRQSIVELGTRDIKSIRAILRTLPLCETVDGSGGLHSHFVSSQDVRFSAPDDAQSFPVNLPERLIQMRSREERSFAQIVGVEQKSKAQVLVDLMLTQRTDEDKEKIAKMALQGISHYKSQHPNFVSTLSKFAFVATRSRGLLAPHELVYHNNEDLLVLLAETDTTPVGMFSGREYLPLLEQLGLRTKPNENEVYGFVQKVEKSAEPKRQTLAQSLWRFIKKNPGWLNHGWLKNYILDMSWVPVVRSRCYGYPCSLPWAGENHVTVAPNKAVSEKYAAVCGSSCVLMPDSSVLPSREPSLKAVVQHLAHCTQKYSSTSEEFEYRSVVSKIYKYLQEKFVGWEVQLEIQSSGLTDWIWKGDGFTSKDHIVAQAPRIRVAPYIHALPAYLHDVKGLFLESGMKEECSYRDVLNMMKRHHDGTGVSAENINRDLKMAVDILEHLSKEDGWSEDPDLLVPVHCTDERLRLLPIKDCVHCDNGIDLEDLTEEGAEAADLNVVHQSIPASLSERLGMAPHMSRSLCAEDLDISYGQSESLVDRISSLLKEYRDGLAILKELIQNADDAGATQVRFIYDERENREHRTSMFDEGMKELQGPALWAYNDALFTEDDFQNLVKLGGKTKETVTNKIGKFGLGFNAVYNLTDVPSFVSGKNIVYFDPLMKYLGKALPNKRNPGIKLDLSNPRVRRRIQRLPDQFHTFNGVLGCDLAGGNAYDKGTLFRFPLRTMGQARGNELCDIHYSKAEMRSLLTLLYESRHTLLLFTQNVRSVSVHHIAAEADSASDMSDVFTIQKSIVGDSSYFAIPRTRAIPAHRALEAAKAAKELGVAEEISATYQLENRFSTGQKAACLVQGCSSGETKDEVKSYLMCSTIGAGKALAMARASPDLVPIAGVAVEVDEDGRPKHGTTDTHVFCFMALPLESPYPIHVNGYFSVTSNRTRLCEQDMHDKKNTGAEWNKRLIEDALCGAYVSLLQKLCTMNSPRGMMEFTIWPGSESSCPQKVFRVLEESFYQRLLDDRGPELFPSTGRWQRFTDCVFMEQNYRHSEVGEVAFGVLKVHCQEAVVDLPNRVYNIMCRSFRPHQIFTEERFLREILLPNYQYISEEERSVLLLDLVLRASKQKGDVWGLLSELPWVPTTPDGQLLKKPAELINPSGPLKSLYDEEERRFPAWSLASIRSVNEKYNLGGAERVWGALMQSLKDLGMKHDVISWDEIVDRAATVESCDEQKGLARVRCLIGAMERSEEIPDKLLQSQLCSTRFLPAAPKPSGYPLDWNQGRDAPWISPNESFLMSRSKLVGSVSPLVDKKIFPQRYDLRGWETIHRILGLHNKDVPLDKVLNQLDAARMCQVQVLEETEKSQLQCIVKEVLSYLQDGIKNGQVTAADLEHLKTEKVLLPDGFERFVDAKEVAFKLEHPCAPFLFELPKAFQQKFREILQFLGVQDNFDPQDFIAILRSLHEENMQSKLCNDKHKLVCNIACNMYQMRGEQSRLPGGECVFLPNQAGILRPSEELCYDDCHWLSADEKMQFCHSDIPFPQAEYLGVKTKRQARVQAHQYGVSFGQREDLTNRLKRLLEGYPCGIEILKELLQNADDAGAKQIHFILDPRTHNADRVFDDDWKQLQGPALLVYNDKPFTRQDMNGIQNLGEGSKANDPSKTGKYGVGFNCVYHVTDTPTFLTHVEGEGKRLVALDPHCSYVTGATKEFPGQMFGVDELENDFPDVFSCYMSDHPAFCTDKGTMFRLPLRTTAMAETSKISNNSFTCEKMDDLFKTFTKELSEMLLFINNVQKVVLSRVDESGEIRELYEVQAQLTEESATCRDEFNKHVKERMARNGANVMETEMKEVVYEMKIKTRSGYHSTEGRLGYHSTEGRLGYHSTEGRLGYHSAEGRKDREEHWTIVQHFGVESANEVPARIKESKLELCPRGGVAYKKSNSHSPHSRPNRVFCFLPLPLKTDLPMHVNGNFALSSEIRHDLLDDQRSVLSDWNEMMYRAIIAPAYVTLIQHLKETINTLGQIDRKEQHIRSYFHLFPSVPKKEEQNLKHQYPLRAGVYQLIHRKRLNLLPMINKELSQVTWHGVALNDGPQTYFNTLKMQMPPEESTTYRTTGLGYQVATQAPRKQKHEKLSEILIRCGMILTDAPDVIRKNFKKCDVPAEAISPQLVASFLRGPHCAIPPLPHNITHTPLRTVDDLVALCRYLDKHSALTGLPIVLTYDNILRNVGASEVYHTQHYRVIASVKHLVLHPKLLYELPQKEFSGLSIEEFARLLPKILPSKCCGKDAKVPIGELPAVLPEDWIMLAWILIEEAIQAAESGQQRDAIKPLEEWTLVPCRHKRQTYLIPLGKANAVLDLHQGDLHSEDLRRSLGKLQCMQPNYDMLTRRNYPYDMTAPSLLQMVATINKPKDVVWALGQVRKDFMQAQVPLTKAEAEVIIDYFASHVHLFENNIVPGVIDTLCHLPIYRTVNGQRVSLQGHCCYIVPDGVPNEEMDAFQSTQGQIFLRDHESYRRLYRFIGCAFLTIEELYCQFVFQQFEMMSQKGRVTHLEFLRKELKKEKKESQIKKADLLLGQLRELRFIEDPQTGALELASHFFDPHTEVFKAMMPRALLPPEPFDGWGWRQFLVDLGMTSEVTEEHMISFCSKLAQIGAGEMTDNLLSNIREKARVLVEHLFSVSDVPSKMFTAIKDIKFLPSHRVGSKQEKLCRQYGQKEGQPLPLQCFSDSAFSPNADYLWSCVPLLPQEEFHPGRYLPELVDNVVWKGRNAYMDSVLSHLGVVSTVTSEQLAKHAHNICRSAEEKLKALRLVSERDQLYEELIRVIAKIFTQLKSMPGSEEHFRQIRCIPVKRHGMVYFAKAAQIVTKGLPERDEIIPYLFSIPLDLGLFEDLFLRMGSVEDASLDTYARVLKYIFTQANDSKLHPDEKQAVMECQRRLIHLIERSERVQLLEDLHLLAQDGKLHRSHELIFVDNLMTAQRMRTLHRSFLVTNESGEFDLNASRALLKLPANLQPRFLTSIVVEVMNDEIEECNCQCELAQEILRKLSSPQFLNGLCRLVRHHRMTHDATQHFDEAQLEPMLQQVQQIQVITVSGLKTHLVHKNQPVAGSESKKLSFIKRVGEQVTVVLDESTDRMDHDDKRVIIIPYVLQIIHDFCDFYNYKMLEAIFTLACDKISEYLTRGNVPAWDADILSNVYPQCGSFLSTTDHALLVQDMVELQVGQYVAVLHSEPLDDQEQLPPSYIYGKVVRQENPGEANLLLRCYVVDVGRGHESYGFLHLHSFQRERPPAADDTFPEPERSVEQIQRELTAQLESAYALPGEMAHQLGRRLLQTWDPQQHPGQEDRARAVYDFLRGEIRRLESAHVAGGEPGSGGDRGLRASAYYCSDEYFTYLQERTASHLRSQQEHRQRRAHHGTTVDGFYVPSRGGGGGGGGPNPQPGEAHRWLKQARHDLQAARSGTGGGDGGCHEWTCYKAHQAAEKALRGAQLSVDAGKQHQHNLLFACWNDEGLTTHARHLQRLVGDGSTMLYPDRHGVPHDRFTAANAHDALTLATNIYDKAMEFFKNQSW